ncbi:MAG TPA: MerR family transcriptional regulator [Myxococcaceae bacterium]|nr:MerR family transcriptional regulator [Myxococcaceae bacterium]
MKDRATDRRTWRIGELAEATGLTVRTLHYYEQIGLLAPATRTEGRQRLYGEEDVRRLYRVRALRDLGLPLAEVGRMLRDDRAALSGVLRAHRARVDAEIERLQKLRALLDHADRGADPDEVLATIEAMSRVVRRGDARRKKGTAPDDHAARWRKLRDRLRACMKAGEPPSAPRPQAVARAARALIVEFAGGDRATLEALAHLRKLDPPEDFAGWTPALMRYLNQALASLPRTEREP